MSTQDGYPVETGHTLSSGHVQVITKTLDVLYAIHQLTSTFVTYIFKITSLTFLFFRRVFDIMLLSHHRV